MKVGIGADHGGFELKNKIIEYLKTSGFDFEDVGTNSKESCDYNEFARTVGEGVASGKYDRGILICGTGIGTNIQANKINGVRAAQVHDMFTAKATRQHNDSNVLTMGGRIIGDELAKAIADIWLNTAFSGEERHRRRVNKLEL